VAVGVAQWDDLLQQMMKARVAGVSPIRSGLEVAVLAAASGGLSFGLGRLASLVLGVDVR